MQGITYQSRGMDLGFFNKRVGEQRVDAGAYHNQATIRPFSTTNTYINYTVRNRSIFDQTKIRLSGNNLFDQHNVTALTLARSEIFDCDFLGPVASDPFNQTTPMSGSDDNPTFVAGRSFVVSVTFGFAPAEQK